MIVEAIAPLPTCEQEVQRGNRKLGVDLCYANFRATQNERYLYWAAKGLMYLGETEQAEKLARGLLSGPSSADAHGILAYLALRHGRHAEALSHAMVALGLHIIAGDRPGRITDLHLLSLAMLAAGDYKAALAFVEQAVRSARKLGDPRIEVAVSLAYVDVLRRIGDILDAKLMLDEILKHAASPCDKAWANLKRGSCEMDDGGDDLAMLYFSLAGEVNSECSSRDVSIAVSISEAWLRRTTDPQAALATLDELAKRDGERVDTLLLRVYIAADRGDFAAAERYLAQAAKRQALDVDWLWEIESAGAELAETRGDLAGAKGHYDAAISMIAELRSRARAQSAYFVSSHRRPFDDLFALLARQGRWREALAVILDLDASDMLRATRTEQRDYNGLQLDDDSEAGPIRVPPSVEDVLSAWHDRNLVIVIAPSSRQIGEPDEHVYRLWVSGGMVTGEVVGDATMARTWAESLSAKPGDESAARGLGAMFIPPVAGDGALDVLAIGSLGRVPLPALRNDDNSLVIRRHPLTRVLGLSARGEESTGGERSVVIANPTGDLAHASEEGRVVARALGGDVLRCGAGAPCAGTRSVLWAARNAELLHVAGHVGSQGRFQTLHLVDGDVDPAEILQQRLAPRLAVLASCGSAAAMDEEGWGSIAAALLESGTAMVVATDRSINDDAPLALIRGFYEQPDWRTDPARALARVQQVLAAEHAVSPSKATAPELWAGFQVLRRPPVVPAAAR
jgi:tetratricopeptide (TPR) repeat protein